MAKSFAERGRKLSVEGAALIGSGYFSKVYQIDEETIVKVLNVKDMEMADREIMLAKWAFANDIPTAISYDIVEVDGYPGLVYESLGRDNLRNAFRDHPEDFDDHVTKYVNLLKSVHSVCVNDISLPKAIDKYYSELETIADYLSKEDFDRIKGLLDTVPETNTLVHRDCHVKNIKRVNGELMLIDLDTLSIGDPIFDFAALYCTYHLFNVIEKRPEFDPFLDLTTPYSLDIYKAVMKEYFTGISEEDRALNQIKIDVMACIHMAWWVKTENRYEDDVKNLIVNMLREKAYLVDNLVIKY